MRSNAGGMCTVYVRCISTRKYGPILLFYISFCQWQPNYATLLLYFKCFVAFVLCEHLNTDFYCCCCLLLLCVKKVDIIPLMVFYIANGTIFYHLMCFLWGINVEND